MKLIIDEKACKKHKMTIIEVLYALAVKEGLTGNNVQEMLNKEILVEGQDSWYMVTQHWSEVLDEILCDSKTVADEERLLKLAEKIQGIFPSGYKQDERTGAKYYHKSNKASIKQALKRFIDIYGDYSDEEILDATQRYVDSFHGTYVPPFQMANYFVCKDLRNKGGDITSPLATFIENKDEGNVETDDWERYARN